ncbi:MAG TPA: MMPL family transporter [Virgibacillus sp.]|nr:MMPL family transporter [Virgibacillus sp.]
MNKFLHIITDRVATKKGMWLTIAIWFVGALLLALFAPSAKEYQVSSLDALPEEAQSAIAEEKVDQYFAESDGIPALLVFEDEVNDVLQADLANILESIEEENIAGLKEILPLGDFPPDVAETFFSEDQHAALIPLTFEATLDSKEISTGLDEIYTIVEEQSDITLYVTGPAGIAVDTTDLFSRADLVLIFSTVGIILILLIITYRSPLLALIPLVAAGFVYEVVNQILGLFGKAGLDLASQSLSIMMILLFAIVIDYSLFIFSRFQEELRKVDHKFEAMRRAMREIGVPIFYSGATILGAMLILLFAKFEDYRNFAPTFGTAVFIVMLSSVTLIPALFTLFGRSAFWPKIPRVGDEQMKTHSLWGKIARFVTTKPIVSVAVMGTFLLLSASHVFTMTYEFDTMKSFPDDMPSIEGYEILEDKFEKGDLAPTTVLFESKDPLTPELQKQVRDTLTDQGLVNDVRISDLSDDEKVIAYTVTFTTGPYAIESMDALEEMRVDADQIIKQSDADGELHFAGETAASVDNRLVNHRDLVVIVVLETILIFTMLIFLTKSFRLPVYMMGTILLSFVAALGLGMFLSNLFFDIGSVSNRVPVYAFVFLVALGIDYNIFLVSRYLEEKKRHPVKKAVEIAVANTGGVISSAGIVLAATFAVLMTQPVEVLFVFGFIVAVGILLDTFLIRGILLPGLLVLLEKDQD